MATVTVRVDRSQATRRLNKLLTAVSEAGTATANEMGEIGKAKAQRLAPYHSGQTFRAIKLVKAKGPEVLLLANNVLRDGHPRNIQNFDLTRWMHTSARARRHIHSGDPHFMYTTRDFLRSIGGNVGGKNFSIRIRGV
jgi:hypothetical protein